MEIHKIYNIQTELKLTVHRYRGCTAKDRVWKHFAAETINYREKCTIILSYHEGQFCALYFHCFLLCVVHANKVTSLDPGTGPCLEGPPSLDINECISCLISDSYLPIIEYTSCTPAGLMTTECWIFRKKDFLPLYYLLFYYRAVWYYTRGPTFISYIFSTD